jgi:hypothetical protein
MAFLIEVIVALAWTEANFCRLFICPLVEP